MKNYSPKNSAGFTLIETLVAIAILMIAIAGPLTVANQALTSALGSRNAMIATYLAQDGMESLKNIKDNKSLSLITCNTGPTCSIPYQGSFSTDSTYIIPTTFARSYTTTSYNSGNELVVTVTVDWTDHAIPNEIKLQELMTNTPR